MLCDKRNYAGALVWPSPPKQGVVACLKRAKCDVAVAEPVGDEDILSIDHCFFYSRTPYTASTDMLDELAKASADDGRKGQYRYSFYLMQYRDRGAEATLLAAPFARLGLHLAERCSPKSSPATFGRIKLARLLRDVSGSSVHRGIRLVVCGVDYVVKGDENGSRLSIAGQNVLEAELFEECEERLHTLDAKPRKIGLTSGAETVSPLRVWFDRYGNWRFRVGARADNLMNMGAVIGYLCEHDLLSATSHVPFLSVDKEDNENF
jgi:hypothetical protein